MRTGNINESLYQLINLSVPISSVIDVGVQHETSFLKDNFSNLHHYLFEPIDEYYPYIKKNYENISYTLFEAAASDIDGVLNIYTEKKTRGDEISHSYIVNNTSQATRNIKSCTLDSCFSDNMYKNNFLLKVDVEGPDVPSRILRGAKKLLKNTSVVVIEMTVDKFMERANILTESGFELWDICDVCYYSDCFWQADAVFIKSELKDANISLRPMHQKPFNKEFWQGSS